MWFKNLIVYRLKHWEIAPERLEEELAKHALQSCSGLEMQTRGWVSPKADGGPLVHTLGQQMLICLGTEKKLLPSTVVNQFAKARAADIEEQQGYKPGRKQLKQIKEDVTDELLPRAFAIRRKTLAWIDPVGRWLVIDAASLAKADEVTETLIKQLEGIAFSLVRSEMSPVVAMTDWLSGDAPGGFTIDRDCELRATGEEKATVRYVRHALESEEIGRHIQAGKEVTRLAMTWNDRISFVLHDNLQLKRLAPLDVLKEHEDYDGADDLFDTDFALMTGELQRLLPDTLDALGGERPD